jgi:hypothetical protein
MVLPVKVSAAQPSGPHRVALNVETGPAQPSLLRRSLMPALKILLAVALLYYVLSRRMIDFDRLAQLFAEPRMLLLAIAALTFQICVGAQRLRMLLAAQGTRLSFVTMLRLTYLGAFFDIFLVTSVGGDAVKAVYLAQEAPVGRRTEAVSTLVLDRLMGLLGLLTLTFVIALWHLDVMWDDTRIRYYFIILIAVSLGLLCGTAMLFSRRVYESRPMQWMLGHLPLGTFIGRAYASLQEYRGRPLVVLLAWLMSLGVHVIGVCAGYALVLGLGIEPPRFGTFFVAWFIANFVCSFAAFGAVGVGQVLYNAIFMTVAQMSNGADLATAAQITAVLAKMPGMIAWLLSRERLVVAVPPAGKEAA